MSDLSIEQQLDSISNLSDEDFLNAPDEVLPEENESIETPNEEEENTDDTQENDNLTEQDNSETSEEETNDENEDETVKEEALDYKATHDRIFQPFKANGRDIQIKDVDEAIRLMQMGVGFHRKMSELKPAMGILRTLEEHNLMDEDKIKLFIDLNNKNPEAIKHFMKSNEIDPLEIDMDNEVDYKSKVNMVAEKQLVLEDTLDAVKDHSHYSETMSAINKWDEQSHEVLADHPQIIQSIVEQKESGVFDIVMNEVERLKILGELNGLSQIHSYKVVGDRLLEQGSFDHLFAKNDKTPTVKPKETEPKTDKVNNEASRNSRRKAISAKVSKSTSTPKVMTIDDIANLGDEEFMKL